MKISFFSSSAACPPSCDRTVFFKRISGWSFPTLKPQRLTTAAPCVGANLEQMACGCWGSELPSTGNSFKTGTSLLQITAVYISSLVTGPFSDTLKYCIVVSALLIHHLHASSLNFWSFSSTWCIVCLLCCLQTPCRQKKGSYYTIQQKSTTAST